MDSFTLASGKGTTIGYHGTALGNITGILEQGFEISRKPGLYLGDGVYFFLDSHEHARTYAAEDRGFELVGVIVATVELDLCLDLLTPSIAQQVCDFIREMRETYLSKGGTLKLTDAVVINMIAQRTQVDTVRGLYATGGKLFKDSRFHLIERVVVAVRTLDNISDVKEFVA